MSFPTEVPDAEPGTYRFRADVEQVGPAVLTAPGSAVGGAFGLFESAAEPGRPGAVPHHHRGFSESFWVISGRLAVMSGRQWQVLGSGDFAHESARLGQRAGAHGVTPAGVTAPPRTPARGRRGSAARAR